MITNQELRFRARNVLGNGIFRPEWLYALVVTLIGTMVTSFSSWAIVGILLTGIVSISVGKYYLYRSRRLIFYNDFNILADGIRIDVGGNIVLGLLITIFTALWMLLFVIPGIVKAYSYSMAYYIKIDRPELTPTQAISESRILMHGHKMRLFLLDLSFIGWIIVGSLCFGIGLLWVNAYIQASRAEFYRDLIGDNNVIVEA
jgi:uncharacterized membrane protein